MGKYGEILEDLGVPRAVVCGLSLGGYAAFRLYRQLSPET